MIKIERNLPRTLLLAIAGLSAFAVPRLLAQQGETAAPQAFEVASVKANNSGTERPWAFEFIPGHDRLVIRNFPLSALMFRAYNISRNRLTFNSPLAALRYDIEAKAGRPVSRREMMRMLQALLADRFKLSLRRETREVSGYALVVGGGPTLTEHTGETAGDCIGRIRNDGEYIFENCSMSFFTLALTDMTDGAYIADKTGLEGSYDFTLKASWELPNSPNPAEENRPRIVNPGAPSIFAALPKQLGLKLERQRLAVEFLFIDHAEKPSGN